MRGWEGSGWATAMVMVVGLAVAWRQREALGGLEEELAVLRGQAAGLAAGAVLEDGKVAEGAKVAEAAPLNAGERIELMRLRDRVTTLREEQRALALLERKNAVLRARIAEVRKRGAEVGEGWMHRERAQMRGCAAPEATLESILWATRERSAEALLKMFVPERRAEIAERVRVEGVERFFEKASDLERMRVVGRKEVEERVVELEVEKTDGTTFKARFREIDGEWGVERF